MSEAEQDHVLLNIADGIADVRLARPSKMNALDETTVAQLVAVGERLIDDRSVRAVILSGEGKAFCAGLDKSVFDAIRRGQKVGGGPTGSLAYRSYGDANHFQRMALVWRDIPAPVIAALHGVVFGGGFQIALGADLRIAAPDTKLSVMEIDWGIIPDCGGTVLMRDLANDGIIRDLTFTGRVFTGTEALAYGFVTRLADDAYAQARATARIIADKNPDAVRAAKRLLNADRTGAPADLLLAESVEQDALLGSPNQVEAVAAKLERRTPVFAD